MLLGESCARNRVLAQLVRQSSNVFRERRGYQSNCGDLLSISSATLPYPTGQSWYRPQHHRQQHYPRLKQQQQQQRWVTSKKRARQKSRSQGKDAFLILGVSRKHSYKEVKQSFVRIAMRHHPDTHAADTEEEAKHHKERFMAARKAFEEIVAGPDGLAILKSESDDYEEIDEHDLDAWFQRETGYEMPFMDARTMKEVAEMTESSEIGLDRDGGMWTLAKMVTQSVKSGGDGRDMLRLEAGTVRDKNIDGILRRRRRR